MYKSWASKSSVHGLTKRYFYSSSLFMKSHYDSLGLTAKATQNDIKTAYYELSKVYHPDKNKGSEEASQKFRDITAAYEILGNLKLRKLYDKGILHTAGPQYASSENINVEHPETKFHKSRVHRAKPPVPTGKTTVYDFDEWTQVHYGETFARRQQDKLKYEARINKERFNRHDIQQEILLYSLLVSIAVTLHFLKDNESRNYDTIKDRGENNESANKSVSAK